MATKNDVIVKSIKDLKKKGVTGLKFEYEAMMNRRRASRGVSQDVDEDHYCEDGRQECDECGGHGHWDCEDCTYDGDMNTHVVENEDYDPNDDSEDAEPEYVECSSCEGSGTLYCDYCDEGWVDCYDCEQIEEARLSQAQSDTPNWDSVVVCHDWLLERLVPYGLAEAIPEDEEDYKDCYGEVLAMKYRPIGALKFSKFYFDGSVDSEWTFTLSIEDDPSVALMAPKFIELFKALGEAVGGSFDISGSGMHTALLFGENAVYPSTTNERMMQRFHNYKRSMRLLLPAVYFLAASTDVSRGLGYRYPDIGYESHRTAIDFRGGALEFRVFDTCYDHPEIILDNLVVMKNTMKFWTDTYKPSGLAKIANNVIFGHDSGRTLERFYQTVDHIDLLNRGLQMLKPSYLTVGEIKAQRKFKMNKRVVRKQEDNQRTQIKLGYKEYADRFNWNMRYRLYQTIANLIDTDRSITDEEARERAEARVAELRRNEFRDEDAYIQQQLEVWKSNNCGNYRLQEESL